jgi:hypothetical protein
MFKRGLLSLSTGYRYAVLELIEQALISTATNGIASVCPSRLEKAQQYFL